MSSDRGHVCPVRRAGLLDNTIRRWLQNPLKILSPYVEDGMTALDVGCGPGFFTVPLAELVGKTGRVIATDLQEGMLEKVRSRVKGTDLEDRITLHRCDTSSIGVSQPVDFVLLFYMVHEVPNRDALFKEIGQVLRPTGRVLLVEPPFHVSRAAFAEILERARASGFADREGPRVLLSKSAILRRGQQTAAGDADEPHA